MNSFIKWTLLLLASFHLTSGWIRFRFPTSRREYLQQTPVETLQNCAGTQECGICGEGTGELSTSGISSELYTPLTANDVINGTLSSDIGFRAGLGTAIEFRLCQVTDNSTYDFEECELSPPLLVRNEAETENQNGAGNQNEIIYQKSFRPNSRQTYAKLSLQVKGRDRCEHCVIQAKYIPGPYSELKQFTFFDCALVNFDPQISYTSVSNNSVLETTIKESTPLISVGRIQSASLRRSAEPEAVNTVITRVEKRIVNTGPVTIENNVLSSATKTSEGNVNTAENNVYPADTSLGENTVRRTVTRSKIITSSKNFDNIATAVSAANSKDNTISVVRDGSVMAQTSNGTISSDMLPPSEIESSDISNSTLNNTLNYYLNENVAIWNESSLTGTTGVLDHYNATKLAEAAWSLPSNTKTENVITNLNADSGRNSTSNSFIVKTVSSNRETIVNSNLDTNVETNTNVHNTGLINTSRGENTILKNITTYTFTNTVNKDTTLKKDSNAVSKKTLTGESRTTLNGGENASLAQQQEVVKVPTNLVILPTVKLPSSNDQKVVDVDVSYLEESMNVTDHTDTTAFDAATIRNIPSDQRYIVNEFGRTRNNRYETKITSIREENYFAGRTLGWENASNQNRNDRKIVIQNNQAVGKDQSAATIKPYEPNGSIFPMTNDINTQTRVFSHSFELQGSNSGNVHAGKKFLTSISTESETNYINKSTNTENLPHLGNTLENQQTSHKKFYIPKEHAGATVENITRIINVTSEGQDGTLLNDEVNRQTVKNLVVNVNKVERTSNASETVNVDANGGRTVTVTNVEKKNVTNVSAPENDVDAKQIVSTAIMDNKAGNLRRQGQLDSGSKQSSNAQQRTVLKVEINATQKDTTSQIAHDVKEFKTGHQTEQNSGQVNLVSGHDLNTINKGFSDRDAQSLSSTNTDFSQSVLENVDSAPNMVKEVIINSRRNSRIEPETSKTQGIVVLQSTATNEQITDKVRTERKTSSDTSSVTIRNNKGTEDVRLITDTYITPSVSTINTKQVSQTRVLQPTVVPSQISVLSNQKVVIPEKERSRTSSNVNFFIDENVKVDQIGGIPIIQDNAEHTLVNIKQNRTENFKTTLLGSQAESANNVFENTGLPTSTDIYKHPGGKVIRQTAIDKTKLFNEINEQSGIKTFRQEGLSNLNQFISVGLDASKTDMTTAESESFNADPTSAEPININIIDENVSDRTTSLRQLNSLVSRKPKNDISNFSINHLPEITSSSVTNRSHLDTVNTLHSESSTSQTDRKLESGTNDGRVPADTLNIFFTVERIPNLNVEKTSASTAVVRDGSHRTGVNNTLRRTLDIALNGAADINNIMLRREHLLRDKNNEAHKIAPEIMPPIAAASPKNQNQARPVSFWNIGTDENVKQPLGKLSSWTGTEVKSTRANSADGWERKNVNLANTISVDAKSKFNRRHLTKDTDEIKKSALNESTIWDINRIADTTAPSTMAQFEESTVTTKVNSSLNKSGAMEIEYKTVHDIGRNNSIKSNVHSQVLKTLEALMLEMKAKELYEASRAKQAWTTSGNRVSNFRVYPESISEERPFKIQSVYTRRPDGPVYSVKEEQRTNRHSSNLPYDIVSTDQQNIFTDVVNREFVTGQINRSKLDDISVAQNQQVINTNELIGDKSSLFNRISGRFAEMTSNNNNDGIGVSRQHIQPEVNFNSAQEKTTRGEIANGVNSKKTQNVLEQSVVSTGNIDISYPLPPEDTNRNYIQKQEVIQTSGTDVQNPFESIRERFSRRNFERYQNLTRLEEIVVPVDVVRTTINNAEPSKPISFIESVSQNVISATDLPNDLVAIEGKYFLGQMRRNELGHFEPIPLAAQYDNTDLNVNTRGISTEIPYFSTNDEISRNTVLFDNEIATRGIETPPTAVNFDLKTTQTNGNIFSLTDHTNREFINKVSNDQRTDLSGPYVVSQTFGTVETVPFEGPDVSRTSRTADLVNSNLSSQSDVRFDTLRNGIMRKNHRSDSSRIGSEGAVFSVGNDGSEKSRANSANNHFSSETSRQSIFEKDNHNQNKITDLTGTYVVSKTFGSVETAPFEAISPSSTRTTNMESSQFSLQTAGTLSDNIPRQKQRTNVMDNNVVSNIIETDNLRSKASDTVKTAYHGTNMNMLSNVAVTATTDLSGMNPDIARVDQNTQFVNTRSVLREAVSNRGNQNEINMSPIVSDITLKTLSDTLLPSGTQTRNAVYGNSETVTNLYGDSALGTNNKFYGQDELLKTIREQFGVNINTKQGTAENADFAQRIKNAIYSETQVASEPAGLACTGGKVLVCKAVGNNQYIPGMVWWCFSHCKNGICPPEKCSCACETLQAELTLSAADRENGGLSKSSDAVARGRQKVRFINLTLNGSEASVARNNELPLEPLQKVALTQQNITAMTRTVRTGVESQLGNQKSMLRSGFNESPSVNMPNTQASVVQSVQAAEQDHQLQISQPSGQESVVRTAVVNVSPNENIENTLSNVGLNQQKEPNQNVLNSQLNEQKSVLWTDVKESTNLNNVNSQSNIVLRQPGEQFRQEENSQTTGQESVIGTAVNNTLSENVINTQSEVSLNQQETQFRQAETLQLSGQTSVVGEVVNKSSSVEIVHSKPNIVLNQRREQHNQVENLDLIAQNTVGRTVLNESPSVNMEKTLTNVTIKQGEQYRPAESSQLTGLESVIRRVINETPSDGGARTITVTVTRTGPSSVLNDTQKNLNLNCVGINAFAGTDGIDAWCTRLCSLDMCPVDICSCVVL